MLNPTIFSLSLAHTHKNKLSLALRNMEWKSVSWTEQRKVSFYPRHITLSLSLSLTHTYTQTHTLFLSLSLLIRFYTQYTYSLTHTNTYTLSPSLSLCLSLCYSLSLSITYTQTHTHKNTHTHSFRRKGVKSAVIWAGQRRVSCLPQNYLISIKYVGFRQHPFSGYGNLKFVTHT